MRRAWGNLSATEGSGRVGFSLIELLIVLAILSILTAIAIPVYRVHLVKARLAEVTNIIREVAAALYLYRVNNNNSWPATAMQGAVEVQRTLGIAIPVKAGKYVKDITVNSLSGDISVLIQNTGEGSVDGGILTLSPTTTPEGAIIWSWSASSGFPKAYIPKR